ncbi:MAG: hypothetical protein ACI4VU_05960 [Methanobrevibacter sp.]
MTNRLVKNLKSMDSKELVKNATLILIIIIAIQFVQLLAQSGSLKLEVIFLTVAQVIAVIIALTGSVLPVGKQRLVLYVISAIFTFISFNIFAIIIGIFYLYAAYKVNQEINN